MKAKFAQKRLSQTGQTTLKVMKQKWQTLAKIKAHFAENHQVCSSSTFSLRNQFTTILLFFFLFLFIFTTKMY